MVFVIQVTWPGVTAAIASATAATAAAAATAIATAAAAAAADAASVAATTVSATATAARPHPRERLAAGWRQSRPWGVLRLLLGGDLRVPRRSLGLRRLRDVCESRWRVGFIDVAAGPGQGH